jgi:hypothetical protein
MTRWLPPTTPTENKKDKQTGGEAPLILWNKQSSFTNVNKQDRMGLETGERIAT